MVQAGVEMEGIHPAPDAVDAPLVHDMADMVTLPGQRCSALPAVGLRIVDFVPVDRTRVATGDRMHAAGEYLDRDRPARTAQRADAPPFVRFGIPHMVLGMRRAVLLDEAAQRIDEAIVHRRHADMVGAVGDGGSLFPAIGLRIVHMVIVAIDPLQAIAADDVHLSAAGRRPCHLAARDGQVRTRHPAALARRGRR
jgi:hypothetical protein